MSIAAAASVLVSFAPTLIDWLTGDDDPVAQKAIDIAKAVTGSPSINDAIEALTGDTSLSAAFNDRVLANQFQFELLLADRASARQNYPNSYKQADSMADRVMRQNLPLAVFMVGAQIGATYFLRESPALLSTATAACTWVIKHLLDERKEVVGFYFGGALSRDTSKKPL